MSFVYLGSDASGEAGDNTPLSDYDVDFQSVLFGIYKNVEFKVGNTGAEATGTLTATGENTGLYDQVEFSQDNATFSSSLSLTLGSGEISETIYARGNWPASTPVASGTIMFDIS